MAGRVCSFAVPIAFLAKIVLECCGFGVTVAYRATITIQDTTWTQKQEMGNRQTEILLLQSGRPWDGHASA